MTVSRSKVILTTSTRASGPPHLRLLLAPEGRGICLRRGGLLVAEVSQLQRSPAERPLVPLVGRVLQAPPRPARLLWVVHRLCRAVLGHPDGREQRAAAGHRLRVLPHNLGNGGGREELL
eukprot:scaffold6432_cov107-Isochrysis_galbana.AAC.1